jgi:hypothetical protein
MFLLHFYRFYLSLCIGLMVRFFLARSWWVAVAVVILVRILWHIVEITVRKHTVNRLFKVHAYAFKQELGPYGIRMINKAEKEPHIKNSLAEVFTPDNTKLRKAVEQLEMMDTLFKAGMRPDADSWQLHDLKLKYGKWRLTQLQREKNIEKKP